MTLQRKSLLTAVVVSVIFLGIGLATWGGLRHEQKVEVHGSLTAISRIQAAQLTQELDATARRLLPNTIEQDLGPLITHYSKTGDDHDQRDMVARLDDIADLVPNVRAVGLVDAAGHVLALSNLSGVTADSARWPALGLRQAIATIESASPYGVGAAFDATTAGQRTDHRYLQVVPVERGDAVIGYLVAEVDMAPLQQVLDGATTFGRDVRGSALAARSRWSPADHRLALRGQHRAVVADPVRLGDVACRARRAAAGRHVRRARWTSAGAA